MFSNVIMNVTSEGVSPAYVVESKNFVDKNDLCGTCDKERETET